MIAHAVVKRTTRYTLVGGFCAVMYNAIMILGSKAGANYLCLSVLALLVVTPIGYLLHARFTFGIGLSWHDFGRFAAGIVASFPVYLIVIAGLCTGLHLNVPIAAPLATVAMYLWNYASAHWALGSWLPFRKRRGIADPRATKREDVRKDAYSE